MEEKKVKIEVSRFALVFIILFALSLLIWSFVIGVWIGTKIESSRKEVTLEEPGISYKERASSPSSSVSYTPPLAPNETTSTPAHPEVKTTSAPASAPVSTPAPTTPSTTAPTPDTKASTFSEKPGVEIKKEKKSLVTSSTSEKSKTKEEKTKEEKRAYKYQHKEVAKIASQIKEPSTNLHTPTTSYYSIQIGAFSQKEIAESLKNKAKAEGFETFMRESKENGKVLYKVYIGKYSTKEEAKKYIPKIETSLNIKAPFIIEIK